jgi:hypothetical protein
MNTDQNSRERFSSLVEHGRRQNPKIHRRPGGCRHDLLKQR